MNVLKFKKFLESNSDSENYLNYILDKMLNNQSLSDRERKFLDSFKSNNQEEFFGEFKDKIEKEQILDNLKIGGYHDIIKFSPSHNVKSTKEVYKAGDNEFELNSTSDGWVTAYIDKETLIKYMVGEIDDFDLDWV